MSESLPKCQWCNEAPVTHPMTDDGVYFHPENGCPSGLGHPVVRLPVRADQWRTLHDQSRCAELESQLEAGRKFNYEKEARIAELEAERDKFSQLLEEIYSGRKRLYPELAELEAENAALRERERGSAVLVRQATQSVQDAYERTGMGVEEALDMVEAKVIALIQAPQQPAPGGE